MEINELSIKKHSDISKELETMNFKIYVLQNIPETSYLQKDFKNYIAEKIEQKITTQNDYCIKKYNKMCNGEAQFQLFQKSMKLLLAYGTILGINPVSGLLETDISKIRFVIRSWKFLYALIIAMTQTVALCLCLYSLIILPISIKTLVFTFFYSSTWCTTIIFFRISNKWLNLVKTIFNCNLDEYVAPDVTKRVQILFIVSTLLGILEHLLAILYRISQVINCTSLENGIYEEYVRAANPWLYTLDPSFSMPISVLTQFINIICNLNWNYSVIFIVCMSLYLTSILSEINKKVIWAADMNYLSSSKWAQLREDYTRATHLVKLFDDLFSGLILITFANNLFFICLQLYNIFANGIFFKQVLMIRCPTSPNRGFGLYIYPLYVMYSLSFMILRFLTLALVAANVNVSSLIPVAALYRIPACAYSKEVQRFIDQIHGGTVALSGHNFFYITRDLVLSVAGTILTYELVLLQFDSRELSAT